MQIFSLRAKNTAEVSRFVDALTRTGISLSEVTTHREPMAVEAEFRASGPLQRLQEAAIGVTSSLLRGTLRAMPRDENPMTYGQAIAAR